MKSLLQNELFGLFADTPMERPAEDLAWNFVNIFHRAGEKQDRKLDDFSDEIRTLARERDQSEFGSANLETVIERARETEQVMASFQIMREQAARCCQSNDHLSLADGGMPERTLG